ncbi:16S/23S rRNA (cytidine-2'-O)-methyltransferase, partial [Mycolicibacterium pulveris]
GLSMHGAVASPLPGPSGNVEYFLWLKKDGLPTDLARVPRRPPGCPRVPVRRRTAGPVPTGGWGRGWRARRR